MWVSAVVLTCEVGCEVQEGVDNCLCCSRSMFRCTAFTVAAWCVNSAFFTWKPFDLDGDALFVFLPNLEGSVCTGSATSHVGCAGVLWNHVLVDSGFA